MNEFLEVLNAKRAYCLLHITAGITWGAAIVMAHVSILMGFWTINTYVTLVWAVLVQAAISYFYRDKGFGVKGIVLTICAAVFTIAGAWIFASFGV